MTWKDFVDALSKDPGLVDKLRKQEGLSAFKEKYHVEKSSLLKCPTCGQAGYSGGSLWRDPDDPTRFVCRKCKIIYFIKTEPIHIDEIITRIKKANKEGTSIFDITKVEEEEDEEEDT